VLIRSRKKTARRILLDQNIELKEAKQDMDGFQVVEQIQQHPQHKDIPIIFVTARDDEASIQKAFDIGGVDYLTKPFLKAELLARVKTQIRMLGLVRHLEQLFMMSSAAFTIAGVFLNWGRSCTSWAVSSWNLP